MAKEGEKAIPVMFTNIAVGLFSGYKGEMYKISIQKSKVRQNVYDKRAERLDAVGFVEQWRHTFRRCAVCFCIFIFCLIVICRRAVYN